jgi:phospholipid N-methyltransferase
MGTMFPCSPAVAKAMVRDLDTSEWSAVVELGPGNGVLTPTFVKAVPRSCRLMAIELSPALAEEFRERVPDVEVVEADAADLMRICLARGIGGLDAIFSALPLKLLSPTALSDVLRAAAAMLKPGGLFAQVTYWPAALTPGKQLRETVATEIGPIESDKLVSGNAPPAWVFRCIKPRV